VRRHFLGVLKRPTVGNREASNKRFRRSPAERVSFALGCMGRLAAPDIIDHFLPNFRRLGMRPDVRDGQLA
jgi:hypothetical protein